ncbi:MBL fold metallo-hydrolase [Kiritimatiella glycovorans]|uniref:Beta-lactamase-like protein n=1 Tax=Kiritimatiella glycovorans TaxID=1307763 RepID=A0A0G3EBP3_9BACT|nr:MBL fold metallo-hydrolase [Kiritimatiella glycovorans]AKJ63876.1 Beta-lactamase-like protein [Kiritimatiella glycovorans]
MQIETLATGPFEVNCYLVTGDDTHALVIDPGAGGERIDRVLREKKWEVAAYLITHGHADHLNALGGLHRRRRAPVAMHPADAEWAFDDRNQIPGYYGVPERPDTIERELADGQIWEDAGLRYRIITTPGHSPGGVCFHFEDEQVLFSGDTLFQGSVGRTDLPSGDAKVLSDSLKKLLARVGDRCRVHPGHGAPTTIGAEKKSNFFLQRLPAI